MRFTGAATPASAAGDAKTLPPPGMPRSAAESIALTAPSASTALSVNSNWPAAMAWPTSVFSSVRPPAAP